MNLNPPQGDSRKESATPRVEPANGNNLTVECPNPQCRSRAKWSAELLGRSIRCRRCKTRFTVEASGAAGPAEEPRSPAPPDSGSLPATIGRFQVRAFVGQGAFAK